MLGWVEESSNRVRAYMPTCPGQRQSSGSSRCRPQAGSGTSRPRDHHHAKDRQRHRQAAAQDPGERLRRASSGARCTAEDQWRPVNGAELQQRELRSTRTWFLDCSLNARCTQPCTMTCSRDKHATVPACQTRMHRAPSQRPAAATPPPRPPHQAPLHDGRQHQRPARGGGAHMARRLMSTVPSVQSKVPPQRARGPRSSHPAARATLVTWEPAHTVAKTARKLLAAAARPCPWGT